MKPIYKKSSKNHRQSRHGLPCHIRAHRLNVQRKRIGQILRRNTIQAEVENNIEAGKEKQEETGSIQTKRTIDDSLMVSTYLQRKIQSLKNGGQSLSGSERAFFEHRFRADFRSVRVHSDSRAAHIARSINARAFTLGRDVVFGAGEYAPGTRHGKRLIAHELTHVLQQNRGSYLSRIQPKSYWFQPPPSKTPRRGILTTAQLRRQVHVETQLSKVDSISVRFAYPQTSISRRGPAPNITKAKYAILHGIAQTIKDLSKPLTGSRQRRRNLQLMRARMSQIFRGFTRSSPLNVFISPHLTHTQLLTGTIAAFTNRVYVRTQDIGNPKKLKAAILIPMQMVIGGVLPTRKGMVRVPKASRADFARTMLHEGLHAMLIRQGKDAGAMWNKTKSQMKLGTQHKAKLIELIRKFLISQEEVFAYTNIGKLYPPVKTTKKKYDSFIKISQRLLVKKGASIKTKDESIRVNKRVAGKRVKWKIRYKIPQGNINLSTRDGKILKLVLSFYPLA